MIDETRSNPHAADETGAAAATPEPQTAGTEPPADAGPDPFLVLQALQTENGELKDRVLRTLADMENLRRRTEKEVKDARDYAITAFARELLAVADNLGRAVSAIPPEAKAAAEGGMKAFVDGVEMTGRELLKAMEKHGVRKIEPLGQRFDPNLHQAMFEIPNGDVTAGTVLQVLQDGFALGDRVLRPALVGVAKGGPKAAPAPAAESASVDRTV
jgi:molecular chaperone GrpE